MQMTNDRILNYVYIIIPQRAGKTTEEVRGGGAPGPCVQARSGKLISTDVRTGQKCAELCHSVLLQTESDSQGEMLGIKPVLNTSQTEFYAGKKVLSYKYTNGI